MKAVTVRPGVADSLRLDDVDEPSRRADQLLVETIAVGVCGTDREVIGGDLGYPEEGTDRLILGHEALGRVKEAPEGSGFAPGDLVAPIVRRPDPVPCPNCAIGEWDMCRNGRFTEAGIRGLDGYAAGRFALDPEFAIRTDESLGLLGVLIEPASVVAKAWEHILHIGSRSRWEPTRTLITGAGPIGLLAALFAARLGGEVHVLDLMTEGPKPDLARDLGATYHHQGLDEIEEVEVVIECTGADAVVAGVMTHTAANGIVCLTGVPSSGQSPPAVELAHELVMENDVVFGTVNAGRRHYEEAARVLAEADRSWLERVVNRRLPVARWESAYAPEPDDVKTVIEFAAVGDATS